MNKEEKIIQNLSSAYRLIAVAILVPILALIIPYRPVNESLPTWFQRSGAVITILTLWAQIKYSSIAELLWGAAMADYDTIGLHKKYFSKIISLRIICPILIAFGTIIWGYGDILIRWLL